VSATGTACRDADFGAVTLQATKLDVGFVVYALTTNGTMAKPPKLYLESSLQNEDEFGGLWSPIKLDSGDFINLFEASGYPQPAQLLTTVDQGFGRYVRWRIEIPENATAITLTLIFKITLLGHG
jgi:hypothetical protein